jgi:hypothetical protein
MGHWDLMCAQEVGEIQDVGSPVLLPLERAKLLGSHADPISDRVCRLCEQTGFQACIPLCGFTLILPALLGSLQSILSVLVCEKLQECRHL